MKKQISIILAICIIFSCVSLCGCSFQGIIDQFTPTTKPSETMQPTEEPTQPSEQPQPTEPTSSSSSTVEEEPQPEPEELVFEHGDNFTEEDIEFVKSLKGNLTTAYISYMYYNFNSLFNNQSGMYPFVGHISTDNPVIICGYLDFDILENVLLYNVDKLDISDYKWYKFDISETIPDIIGEDEKIWSFLVLDAWIEKNALTNEECYYEFKYYMDIKTNAVPNFFKQYETMIVYTFKSNYISGYHDTAIRCGLFRPGYVDKNGVSYLVFQEQIIHQDGTIDDGLAQGTLKEYYDILKPYFEILEELDDTYESDGETCVRRYVGVKIETLKELSLVYERE